MIVAGTDEGGVTTTERAWKRYPSGVFVSRLSPDGKRLHYSTLLHPSSTLFHDFLHVASAGPGTVLVSGSTLRPDFPTTPGAFDRVFNSDGTGDGFHRMEGFVARLTLEAPPAGDTTAAAPALVSPANRAAFPTGTMTLPFDWTDVADPSGLQVYEVALAANPDFATGYGLRMPGFVPASQWETWFNGDGVYYWRVRTLDRANNFSPWSETRSFRIGNTNWTNFCAVTLTPEGVSGGSTVQGKLYSVPPSVTVPAGANTATFVVTRHAVSRSTPVQLTVWAEGNGDHPVLWVDPAPAGVLAVSSVTLTPSSVVGGTASQGMATLNGAAPEGGAMVTLTSSHSAASVPPSVTVTAGSMSANFGVWTQAVSSSTSVAIGAAYGGSTRSATLTLTPAAAPAPPAAPSLLSPANDARFSPGRSITFDWSDVTGAVSYTIQIDDDDRFPAPQVRTQTTSQSSYTTSTLPTRRMYWRVRATAANGTTSNWSSVRRFEVKN